MAKRGERVAPPPHRGEWELRFGESEAAAGWEELRSDLGTRTIKGKALEQWQYEVTGAGRIWYCPDDSLHVVFITKASTGHPGQTD